MTLLQDRQHGEAHARVPQAHRAGAALLPVGVALLPQHRRARLLLREDQSVRELRGVSSSLCSQL